jgi:hypothetical protein
VSEIPDAGSRIAEDESFTAADFDTGGVSPVAPPDGKRKFPVDKAPIASSVARSRDRDARIAWKIFSRICRVVADAGSDPRVPQKLMYIPSPPWKGCMRSIPFTPFAPLHPRQYADRILL